MGSTSQGTRERRARHVVGDPPVTEKTQAGRASVAGFQYFRSKCVSPHDGQACAPGRDNLQCQGVHGRRPDVRRRVAPGVQRLGDRPRAPSSC